MEDTIDESIIKDKELGFTLCQKPKNKQLSSGHLCEGEQCQVVVLQLPKECKKGEIPVGTFHTHGGRSSPSMHDLLRAYQSNAYCIGDCTTERKR